MLARQDFHIIYAGAMSQKCCTVSSLERLIPKAKTFVASAKSPGTLKAYRNDWHDFESWTCIHNLPKLHSTLKPSLYPYRTRLDARSQFDNLTGIAYSFWEVGRMPGKSGSDSK